MTLCCFTLKFHNVRRSDKVIQVVSRFKSSGTRRVGYRRTTLLLALSTFVACGGDSITCTLIGDMTGLTVNLSAVPSGPYSVEVLVASSSPVSYIFRCDGGLQCRSSQAFFPGLIATDIAVRVTTLLGTRTTAYQHVAFSDSYPNGPSCEPRATTATVTALLPE